MDYKISKSCQIKNLDEIYNRIFGDKRTGFFIDVGAYDGYEWSNTWGLSEVGWEGLCIEPYPMYAEKCSNLHTLSNHKVETLECAVGNVNCRCNMFLDPKGPSHSIDENTVVRSPWGFSYDGSKLEVECFTLDFILDKMIMLTKHIDVLSIDVEGAEIKVLEGFSVDIRKPTLIILETHEGQEGKDYNNIEIDAIMRRNKYEKIQTDGLNSIYTSST